jgi:uncharacterized protein (DUF302 family)
MHVLSKRTGNIFCKAGKSSPDTVYVHILLFDPDTQSADSLPPSHPPARGHPCRLPAPLPRPTAPPITAPRSTVQHVCISTAKPYADVKRDLETRLGRLDDGIRALLRNGEIEAVRDALKKAAGTDGLAIHYVGPHGDWLALNGDKRNATAYLIGNVLYAVQMTRVHLAAGLYAPLRAVVYENDEGGTTLEYDKPSTLFGQFKRPEIDDVAAILDERMNTLLMSVAGSTE